MGDRVTKKERLARVDAMAHNDYENWQKWARRNNKTIAQAIDATIIRERKLLEKA